MSKQTKRQIIEQTRNKIAHIYVIESKSLKQDKRTF